MLGRVTLAACLRAFTSAERVEGVECMQCAVKARIDAATRERSELFQLFNASKAKAEGGDDAPPRAEGAGDAADEAAEEGSKERLVLRTMHRLKEIEDELGELRAFLKRGCDDRAGAGGGTEEPPAPVIKPLRLAAYKCLKLTRLPAVLCIHFRRRHFQGGLWITARALGRAVLQPLPRPNALLPLLFVGAGRFQKVHTRVIFGMTLNMAPFVGEEFGCGGAPLLYRLMAVIVHHGSAGGGHFTTHRRLRVHRGGAVGQHESDGDGQWVHVSDLHTQQVSAEQVMGCEAYMLFYEAV